MNEVQELLEDMRQRTREMREMLSVAKLQIEGSQNVCRRLNERLDKLEEAIRELS
jgi:hypothetical protein